MKPSERDIHLRMIQTLCNMLSAEAPAYKCQPPDEIEILAREIAERELEEAQPIKTNIGVTEKP